MIYLANLAGPGGPAWDSKHITLRDAESRYKSWKHMVDQRKHGSTFVTEQEKEAMHRKRQQERDSAELENAYQAQKVALEMGPLERVMGYVHEGDAFGEAECVEDVAFSTSAVGKKMHELDHDNSLTTKSKNEAAAILVALSMEDYLKLWPKRAKLVRERALWLHKAAACFLPFDRTDLVRVMSSSDVLEERILPGDVMCSQGDVPDKIRVVLSGSFSVQRQVNVDRAIKASRRINDQWMGPSDDWDSPKLVGLHDLEIESVAKEDRLEKSSTCEGVPSKKESTAIGVVDKSRAARALRRVVGFSGLSTSAKAHQQKKPRAHIPGCNDTAGNEHANVLVEVRRLEVGESFGFWGMIFKGQSEPNRIVARCECKVLSIPIAKVAQLKFDPDLRASFMEKQRLLVGVNEQQYQTMSALKRAQLVGRISAAQAWKFVDHLDGLDKEVPGRILKKDPYQYLPAASSGLEKHVPKTEHVPQVARVHTNLGDTSGLTSCVDRSQQGDADDKSLKGEGEYQKLLPHSLDMDAYMQRIYCDPNRNLGPQYREKEIPHLDYFEPVRHHHFKQVQEVFARRKAPDVLPYESMSAMCFDAMVLHSEKKVLSQHEAALQDKLLKLVDIFNTRRAKANTMNQVCNIREDVYISMLRESQLLIPRCCTKEMSSQLTFQKNAIDSHQASQIFSFHAMSGVHQINDLTRCNVSVSLYI
jgi:CRP-like cAMP-binding protein